MKYWFLTARKAGNVIVVRSVHRSYHAAHKRARRDGLGAEVFQVAQPLAAGLVARQPIVGEVLCWMDNPMGDDPMFGGLPLAIARFGEPCRPCELVKGAG